MADLQFVLPHPHGIPAHIRDPRRVDEIAAVAAHEVVGSEQRRQIADGVAPFRHAVRGDVVAAVMPRYLDVLQIAHGDAQVAPFRRHDDEPVVAAAHGKHRPPHLDAEIVIRHGLDDKIEGGDFVPLDGELRHAGDEDEDGVAVPLAQLCRRLHAVHARHHDIHEDDVVFRAVFFQKRKRVFEQGNIERLPFGTAELLQIAREDIGVLLFVLHDGDADHIALPCSISLGRSAASLAGRAPPVFPL